MTRVLNTCLAVCFIFTKKKRKEKKRKEPKRSLGNKKIIIIIIIRTQSKSRKGLENRKVSN